MGRRPLGEGQCGRKVAFFGHRDMTAIFNCHFSLSSRWSWGRGPQAFLDLFVAMTMQESPCFSSTDLPPYAKCCRGHGSKSMTGTAKSQRPTRTHDRKRPGRDHSGTFQYTRLFYTMDTLDPASKTGFGCLGVILSAGGIRDRER